MSAKLMRLLFPRPSDTMSEREETVFLSVLQTAFRVAQEGTRTKLVWALKLPGRYRQIGREVLGNSATIMGQSLPKERVIWMLLTGKVLKPSDRLLTYPAYPNDSVCRSDAHTWRQYSLVDFDAMFAAPTSPARVKKTPYINVRGKRVKGL